MDNTTKIEFKKRKKLPTKYEKKLNNLYEREYVKRFKRIKDQDYERTLRTADINWMLGSLKIEESAKKAVKLSKVAPGHSYISFAKIILTKKAYTKIMEPSILMMQEECFEYYKEDNLKFVLITKIRFAFIFLFILGLNLPLISQLLDIKEKFAK